MGTPCGRHQSEDLWIIGNDGGDKKKKAEDEVGKNDRRLFPSCDSAKAMATTNMTHTILPPYNRRRREVMISMLCDRRASTYHHHLLGTYRGLKNKRNVCNNR